MINSRQSQQRRRKPSTRRRTLFKKKPPCPLLSEGIKEVDYKDLDLLNRYAGDDMKIVPAADNNISARMQRRISKAIKQARYLSLLPYTRRHSINEEK